MRGGWAPWEYVASLLILIGIMVLISGVRERQPRHIAFGLTVVGGWLAWTFVTL